MKYPLSALRIFPHPSLPSWECGLKFFSSLVENYLEDVTPLVGVWIEIYGLWTMILCHTVTPLVGVWIEISKSSYSASFVIVTPLVGVWIEISSPLCSGLCVLVTPLVGVWIEI